MKVGLVLLNIKILIALNKIESNILMTLNNLSSHSEVFITDVFRNEKQALMQEYKIGSFSIPVKMQYIYHHMALISINKHISHSMNIGQKYYIIYRTHVSCNILL